ncbi:MAG: hypothetical protein PHO08_07580 [Methylococcales bacterium]|nr:hypothetical protein [Methylococcales bacterium]
MSTQNSTSTCKTDSKEAIRPMMKTVFHADLSDAHPGEEYWVHANGKRHKLVPHTNETRAQLRASSPHLNHILDEHLTHFTEQAATLPADRALRVHIKHTLKNFPGAKAEFGVHHVAIHVPPKASQSKSFAFEKQIATPHAAPINWVTTAQALLFHHPDLINHDTDATNTIMDYMNNNLEISAKINQLAQQMREMGPPTEKSGWALLVPYVPPKFTRPEGPIPGIKDEDIEKIAKEAPTVFDGTKTYYKHQPTGAIQLAAGDAMTAMMKVTKNDNSLRGKKWQLQDGASLTPANPHSLAGSNPQNLTGPSRFRTADIVAGSAASGDQWTAAISNTDYVSGLMTTISVVDSAKKQIQIDLSNQYIRYLGAYIRFFDAEGTIMSVPDWKPDDGGIVDDIINALDIQYDDMRFIGFISPKNNIMAIPIPPDGQLSVKVTFPKGAVKATVYGAGLGTGADLWPKTPVVGGVMTALCNLTIPTFMLAFGAASLSNKPLYDLLGNPKVIGGLIFVGVGFFGAQFASSGVEKKMNWSALTNLLSLLFDKAATRALIWVEAQTAAEDVAEEIPFAGWIVLAVNIATGIAQMAETIIEVSMSPWNIENNIALSILTTVTVHPDPRHKTAFPSGKNRHCSVKMIYKDQLRATLVDSFDISDADTSPTLTALFEKNTLGGEVKFEADYYVGDWLAAKATTGWMKNDEADVQQVDLFLIEFPVPLTEKTVYSHTQVLTYKDSQYGWTPTPDAPAYVSPNASPTGNAISTWTGLTLSQRSGMLGFGWKAAGMGITSCVSGAGGQLYGMANINIPGTPMTSVKFPACGLDGQSLLIYDPYPPKFLMGKDGQWVIKDDRPVPDPKDTVLGDYYVDPTKAANALTEDGGFHLRKVTLDDITPFNMSSNQLSHARFQYPPDSIVLHPSGNVIAVNTQFCKIQVAKLVLDGDQDKNVPLARVYAGEALNTDRPGLVFHPIAVTSSYDGTLMVLEDTKWSSGTVATVVARIQAFDLMGHPVNRFFDDGNQPTSFLYLADPVNNNYLDMVAVGDQKMTYIYVLYNQPDPKVSGNYLFFMDVYQYGASKPAHNPLLTAKNVIGAKMTADMWHTVYTLNYDMVTDGQGHHAGPVTASTGPDGRTVPSVSEWLPSTPTK